MCMSIPMQVLEVDGLSARCSAKGLERVVSLVLLMDAQVQPGDMLVVHAGMATERIDAEQARMAWETYDLMLAALDAANGQAGAAEPGAAFGSGPMANPQ